jgi:NitT/TauT family transport system substrate-binding protein
MRRIQRMIVATLLILAASIFSVHVHIAHAERIKIGLPSRSMGYLPLFVALHRGFFKDESIDLDLPLMLPNIAHNALLSGEIDYHGLADSALRLAAKGAPIKTIFFGTTLPNYFLMAKPQIKTVADLRGKYIGVSRFGGTTDLAARIALQKNGLDPHKDVVLIMIGLAETRNAALMAGSIDATIANPPDNAVLKQKGYRELLFLGDAIEFPSNGFATTDRRLSENRGQVKRLLRALYRGLQFAHDHPAETTEIIESEYKMSPALARESYASLAKSLSKDGTASDAGLRVHVKLIQSSEKGLGEIPFGKMVDFSLIEEIRREQTR